MTFEIPKHCQKEELWIRDLLVQREFWKDLGPSFRLKRYDLFGRWYFPADGDLQSGLVSWKMAPCQEV